MNRYRPAHDLTIAATTIQAQRTAQTTHDRTAVIAALAEIIDGIKEVQRGANRTTNGAQKYRFFS